MTKKQLIKKNEESVINAVFGAALEVVVRERPISDQEASKFLSQKRDLPPAYEAVAKKRLTPKIIAKIIKHDLESTSDKHWSEDPAIALFKQYSLNDKPNRRRPFKTIAKRRQLKSARKGKKTGFQIS